MVNEVNAQRVKGDEDEQAGDGVGGEELGEREEGVLMNFHLIVAS